MTSISFLKFCICLKLFKKYEINDEKKRWLQQNKNAPLKIAQLPSSPLLTRERVLVLLQASTIRDLVLELLAPDVVLNGLFVQPHGADVIALGPEMPGPVIVLEVGVLVENHQARLAFQIPHEARNGELRGYAYKHVYVVGHRVRLDDVDALVHAASPDVFADVGAELGVNRLPSVFRREHDVVFAIPFRVRQTRHFVVFGWHNIKVLLGPRATEHCNCTPKEDFFFMTATAFYLLARIAGGFVLSLTVHIRKTRATRHALSHLFGDPNWSRTSH